MTAAELKALRESLPARAEKKGGRPSSGGNGWTQKRFAEVLGIPRRSYEKYEAAGAIVPTIVERLARLTADAIRTK